MHGVIPPIRHRIAIVGTGISGMSAAWLLSQRHDITVYEQADRIGGHSNTVLLRGGTNAVAVDTGFIVYNERTYPNLTALFAHLDVPTTPSDMSFSVSLDDGAFEYAGGCGLNGLIAQKRNIARPRYWSLLGDLVRFYRSAAQDLPELDATTVSLRDYLHVRGYGSAFRDDHLLPMAAAIWSAPTETILDFPAASFIRFFDNHGLLEFRDRPQWRTVVGGSRVYAERLTAPYRDRIRLGAAVSEIVRECGQVRVRDSSGHTETFDHVVVATHANQALRMLADPSDEERDLLGAFRYSRNLAVLHADPVLMPKRRAAWAAWNHLGRGQQASVTYWMNRLQPLPDTTPLFVTLNPTVTPRDLFCSETYEHPILDAAAAGAQRHLWSLQGRLNTWFCGAHFGAGFHEDALQAGLAVAEALGGGRRPWLVTGESSRIFVTPMRTPPAQRIAA
ncbi:MAG: FAD-dependent oxidoreductase [Bauldia sp.]|nr:FAD-dependent oxidoreductase [Bauldia sp.]